MITRTGQIEFSRYMSLERIFGSDRALAIINEVTLRLEKEGYLHNTMYTDHQIKLRSEQLYEDVMMEWQDDDIPYQKNKV